jgi:hypothetical protein
MAIFPSIKVEGIVQVLDKTRIDGSHSFVSTGSPAILSVEIDPDGSGYVDVTSTMYLDWVYSTAGAKTPKVKITVVGGALEEITGAITSVTAATDNLFSTDEDLQNHEPDILKWIREGRSSYKDVHRRAQELILDTLYRLGFTDNENNRLTAADLIDVLEIREWSTFLTLHIIFFGLSNAVDDVFARKAAEYLKQAQLRMDSKSLKADLDGDGDATNEGYDMTSISVFRR